MKVMVSARFIDSATVAKTLDHDAYSDYLVAAVGGLFTQMRAALVNAPQAAPLRQTSCRFHFSADDPRRSDPKWQTTSIRQNSNNRH